MKAAIDIGTNTVLLLVAEITETGLKVVHEEQRMPRLGKGVDLNKTLSINSIHRVVSSIKEYKNILETQYNDVSEIVVTATSAVRDASNKNEFISTIKKETGFDVQLLSGAEEALLKERCRYWEMNQKAMFLFSILVVAVLKLPLAEMVSL